MAGTAFLFCFWIVTQGCMFLSRPLYTYKLEIADFGKIEVIRMVGNWGWHLVFPVFLFLLMIRLTAFGKKKDAPVISPE
jgi:hypothetical protein